MAFPKSYDELTKAGYHFDSIARCKYCEKRIEFWVTPAGRKIPLYVDERAIDILPHFANCPNYPGKPKAAAKT